MEDKLPASLMNSISPTNQKISGIASSASSTEEV